jgi:hypothetical protein
MRDDGTITKTRYDELVLDLEDSRFSVVSETLDEPEEHETELENLNGWMVGVQVYRGKHCMEAFTKMKPKLITVTYEEVLAFYDMIESSPPRRD